jgi:hypothetical protein
LELFILKLPSAILAAKVPLHLAAAAHFVA